MRLSIKIILIVTILFLGCKVQGEGKKAEVELPTLAERESIGNSDLTPDTNSTMDFSFLNNFKTVSLPYKDSTNFENHKIDKLLSYEQIKSLGLEEVLGIPSNAIENSKIGVNYLLDLSPNFKSIVFYHYFFDHEISSTLVNYDSEFNVIDKRILAMDEIAESILRMESLIEKDKITITNYQFLNETFEETEIVKVQSDGTIKTWR